MRYAKLSDNYSVATQIDPTDVEFFAEQGYTTIVCNRPDGEDPGQPPSANIEAACSQHDIDFHMIPMQGTFISPDTVELTRSVIEQSRGPVLAYCRSGTRSAMIWELATAGDRAP
jgi:sulfide:quinone oxidoreductase